MNRRALLATLSSGVATALAGCSQLSFGGDSEPTPEPTPTDTDHDGVPDEEDYAPWDEAIQNKSDILDEYWGRTITPEDGDPTAVTSLFLQQPASIRTLPPDLSGFAEYTPTSATVRVRRMDQPATPHRLLVVARKFPRGEVVGYGLTDALDTTSDVEPTVSFRDELPTTQTPLYYAAYLVPDTDVESVGADEIMYLHETDPFRVEGGDLTHVPTEYKLDPLDGERFRRKSVEGGYTIHLSGRTQGADWEVAYFVSRAAYERKRTEPRGRSREEYVRFALTNGTGAIFTDILTDAARRAGITARREQAELAIDVVQSLPYVRDTVGTGFDDYPKFVEETMAEVRGDCEDSTIALAVMLAGLGYDVVLIEFDSHIGLGMAGEFEGSYVVYDAQPYYYVETTSEGWAVGDLPQTLDASNIKVSAV